MKNSIYVINTVSALGADAALSGGVLGVAGVQIPIGGLLPVTKQSYVAGVSQITTGVVTAASSTTYGLTITSNSTIDGSPKTWTVPDFVSDASATRTEIATVLMNALNQFNDMPVTATLTGSGTTKDLVLTADAPWYVFSAINTATAAGVVTYTTGTAGVNAVGLGSVITSTPTYASGLVTSSESIEATSHYTTYTITYLDQAAWGEGTHQTQDYSVLYLYVKETATYFPTLCGEGGTLTQGLKGMTATWSAAAGTGSSMSNGVITLGGSDIFYGNSDTNLGLHNNDMIYLNAVFYTIGVLSGTTAWSAETPNDQSTSATQYIKLRSGL